MERRNNKGLVPERYSDSPWVTDKRSVPSLQRGANYFQYTKVKVRQTWRGNVQREDMDGVMPTGKTEKRAFTKEYDLRGSEPKRKVITNSG